MPPQLQCVWVSQPSKSPLRNASATAVWEAAPVRTIDKRYGRERGHKATLAAHLRESSWAPNAISPSRNDPIGAQVDPIVGTLG
jgi:hypothetical protein